MHVTVLYENQGEMGDVTEVNGTKEEELNICYQMIPSHTLGFYYY